MCGNEFRHAVQRLLDPHVGGPVLHEGFHDHPLGPEILRVPFPFADVGHGTPVAAVAVKIVGQGADAHFCQMRSCDAAEAVESPLKMIVIGAGDMGQNIDGGRQRSGDADEVFHGLRVQPEQLAARDG